MHEGIKHVGATLHRWNRKKIVTQIKTIFFQVMLSNCQSSMPFVLESIWFQSFAILRSYIFLRLHAYLLHVLWIQSPHFLRNFNYPFIDYRERKWPWYWKNLHHIWSSIYLGTTCVLVHSNSEKSIIDAFLQQKRLTFLSLYQIRWVRHIFNDRSGKYPLEKHCR